MQVKGFFNAETLRYAEHAEKISFGASCAKPPCVSNCGNAVNRYLPSSGFFVKPEMSQRLSTFLKRRRLLKNALEPPPPNFEPS